jgi:molybdenum cofactor cytidylyltransferase
MVERDAVRPEIAAIVLAAGLSTRMGTPKPLLPWDGRTLVEYQVAQLVAAEISQVIVVTGHAADEVERVLAGSSARVVRNPQYREGRAGSVRVGAAAVREPVTAVLTLNVDQPRPAELIRAIVLAHLSGDAAITVPVWAGRRGHPAVFAGALLPELRAVTEDGEGLRAVRRAHAAETRAVDLGDPRVLVDINTPESYREARRLFGLEA